MQDKEDWLPEDDDASDEWSLKDAEELIEAYKQNANKKWEIDLLDWIIDRVWRYEDLNS